MRVPLWLPLTLAIGASLTGCGGSDAAAPPCAEAKAAVASHLHGATVAASEAANAPHPAAADPEATGLGAALQRVLARQPDERIVASAQARQRSEVRLAAQVIVDNASCFSVEERASAREFLDR